MKNGKRMSVAERKYIDSLKMQSINWLISKKTTNEWTLVHKLIGQVKVVPAP